jgi:hypothetical protein
MPTTRPTPACECLTWAWAPEMGPPVTAVESDRYVDHHPRCPKAERAVARPVERRGGVMHIRWYRPDPGSLSYLIVKRILEIRVWRAELALYWHYR